MRYICLLVFSCSPLLAQNPTPPALADALWKAHLSVHINGILRNHYIANRPGKNGPAGFIKEKSSMKLDHTLDVFFLINSVGEISMVSQTKTKADQTSNLEEKYSFTEETILEGDIKSYQDVQVKEAKVTKIIFSHEDKDFRLPNGFLSVLPSGKLDKKGTLAIVGDMLFTYQGKGSYHLVKERNPPSSEYAILEEDANLTGSFDLPVTFRMDLSYKKKPVEKMIQIPVNLENPFSSEERTGKNYLTSDLKGTCTLKMVPLFGKYMNQD
ncbi:MAG: hypothetical protein CSA81_08150 [Acidobacteria bacterium]|nr:MAG: hypothetical protein CSA81_08150 [Acidobacteriota bacterium]PIE89696.1 MAG: hypothetical protein CR997_09685 [Acidobacteriota bacterium]